jgi:hypothetical protein
MYSLMSYPRHLTKFLVHIILSDNLSSINTSSIYVELSVLHFIIFDELITAPFPIFINHPIWPLQSSWTWCEPSTYANGTLADDNKGGECNGQQEE